jgi:hypothetical protein
MECLGTWGSLFKESSTATLYCFSFIFIHKFEVVNESKLKYSLESFLCKQFKVNTSFF